MPKNTYRSMSMRDKKEDKELNLCKKVGNTCFLF